MLALQKKIINLAKQSTIMRMNIPTNQHSNATTFTYASFQKSSGELTTIKPIRKKMMTKTSPTATFALTKSDTLT